MVRTWDGISIGGLSQSGRGALSNADASECTLEEKYRAWSERLRDAGDWMGYRLGLTHCRMLQPGVTVAFCWL